MKFNEAIKQTKQDLSVKYKDVICIDCEVVDMTSNTTTSSYIQEKIDIDTVDVEWIEDRFTIEGEIRAIEVVFDVKLPRKRKYSRHEEYYKIVG